MLLGAIIVVAAGLRIVLAAQDLFADELSTYWIISTNDLPGVVETVHTTAEITPPLSFVLSWIATRIDLTPELLRLPALIAGVASIPLVYLIGLRVAGRGAGFLAAALTALSPFMIYYSAEARGYGLMMALVLGSTLALLLALDRGARRWWVAYAICACAAVYTHYTCVFVLGAQFFWVLWTHPETRRAAIAASVVAAIGFLPWLSGLRADLDSPTTGILSSLSPFNPHAVRITLEHWLVGFPYSGLDSSSLRELPGIVALALLAAAAILIVAGSMMHWGRVRGRIAEADQRVLLLVALALATPLGEALASLLGPNVFGTRNLAASWPYVALAGAAFASFIPQPLRLLAGTLAVTAFAVAGVMTIGADYQRPTYAQVAAFVENGPSGVVVDAATLTPGPLTNFDISLDERIDVFRLGIPDETKAPFTVLDPIATAASIGRQAGAAAHGGPITVVTADARTSIPGRPALVRSLIRNLPAGYQVAGRRSFGGLIELKALLFERRGAG